MDEMERWLAPLGLAQFAPVLRAHDLDLEILPELSEADLEKLGLSLGQRRKLLKAAAEPVASIVVNSPQRQADAEPERRLLSRAAATDGDVL